MSDFASWWYLYLTYMNPILVWHALLMQNNSPLSRVHFGESLVVRLYSEIDHTYLSIEAQCVSHNYPRWTATIRENPHHTPLSKPDSSTLVISNDYIYISRIYAQFTQSQYSPLRQGTTKCLIWTTWGPGGAHDTSTFVMQTHLCNYNLRALCKVTPSKS